MIKRDALARERAEAKRKEKEEKEAREVKEEQEAKNKQRKIILERSRPKEAMTWAEMQEVQERMREERIAMRVVEMSSRIGKHDSLLLIFLKILPPLLLPLILPLLLFLPLFLPLSLPSGFEPSKSSEGIARQTARSKLSPAPDAPAPVEDPKAVRTFHSTVHHNL
jgi:hypothetical protein